MTDTDDLVGLVRPGRSFALSGPSRQADPAVTPVRGDLAHVRLAGKVFVPHYAVPMPHRARLATAIHEAPRVEAPPVGAVAEGTVFDVLDIAGDWAWGLAAGDGGAAEDCPVGYVPLSALDPVA